jgi:hypothetical protein
MQLPFHPMFGSSQRSEPKFVAGAMEYTKSKIRSQEIKIEPIFGNQLNDGNPYSTICVVGEQRIILPKPEAEEFEALHLKHQNQPENTRERKHEILSFISFFAF